jgi:TRAP-type transport system periplasmic protein
VKRFSVILSLLVALALIMSIVSCSQTPAPAITTSAPPATTTAAPPTTSAPAPTTSKPPVTTTAPATTSAPTTTAATTAAAKYPFRMAPIGVPPPLPEGSNPPPSGASLFFANYAKLLGTKSNGQVKVEVFFAQSLVPTNQIVTATSTGVADIGAASQDDEGGKLPLSVVSSQPGYSTDWWALSMAYWDLMNQEPLISEYAKYNLLPLGVLFDKDYSLIANKPIRTIADLKGKKIACGGMQAQILQSQGAVPVALGPPEQYEGMQKGTIDGIAAGLSPISDFKFYEAGKYFTTFSLGGKVHPILINKNSWNKLPADIQATFKAMIPDVIQVNVDSAYRKGQPLFPMSEELIKANNITVITPSAEDAAALKKVQGGMADAWAAATDKAGMPGSKILADYRALIAKYEKVSTFAFK